MHPLETYLRSLHDIHASGAGVQETSYYGAIERLFNDIGSTLKPRVRCVLTLKNRGAGLPDGGLFTADQLQKGTDGSLLSQIPARGVVEVKGTGDDVARIARSDQVARYLARYGQVLVTNYRDFLLVTRDAAGVAQIRERYTLASSEGAFWSSPLGDLLTQHGEPFTEYLRRALLSNAALVEPKDVAWFLASYARDARTRVERATLPALDTVRRSLEEALGITFSGERGEHFFRSTLVQTLFYGIFSAWVLWSSENDDPTARFDWRTAGYYLRVPMMEALFAQVAAPQKLRPLGIMEVLDWTGAALNRIDRPNFFARFEAGAAVQYFYEPFLEAFDPELRKQLGVWYTPPEIVRYQVARVDTVLKEELGIADGLADERVRVLDPCCGTGAYLVEVLRHIAATLREGGGDALLGDDLKRAARERIFGFELLPAPFVVAHLQLGLLLQSLGAPLAHEGERVGVYLTNALTGWEPPDPKKEQIVQLQLAGLPELQEERDMARQVKRDAPILVILGNPPYDGYAAISGMEEERDLSNAYRTTKRAPKPEGQGLNNLFVRFFRMAERRIVEQTGRGVVCFISPYIWLDGLSFTGMRERYLEVFDQIWIDNLHGDRKISERTPEGLRSGPIFEVSGYSPGIKVGVAISTLVKNQNTLSAPAHVFYRDFHEGRAADRRSALVSTISGANNDRPYIALEPQPELGLPFKIWSLNSSYLSWPLLPDLFPVSFPGVKTSRDDVVIDIDRDRLERRMRQYFDPAISHADMKRIAPGIMEDTSGFSAQSTRDYLRKRGFLQQNIIRYCYRPFDVRWLYWEPETKLLDRNRAEYQPHVFDGNIFLFTTGRTRKDAIEPGITVRVLSDLNCMDSGARGFPLYLKRESITLFDDTSSDEPLSNASETARSYVEKLSLSVEELFFHCLAILHSPLYRHENQSALKANWPRVPLPAMGAALVASAALGRQVAALLDSETPLAGVSQGSIRPELRPIGVITWLGSGGPQGDDLAVTARWGFAGRDGITMSSSRGKSIARDYTASELAALGDAAGLLGAQTYDIYLNDLAYWSNIPERVWEYTIGGYQVLKKWLSYRERELLGRPLTPVEAREVTSIARRIAALLLLEGALDASYRAVKGAGV